MTKESGRQPLQQVGSNNMTSSSSFEPFVFKGGSQENLSQSQPLRVPNLSRSNSTVSINKSKIVVLLYGTSAIIVLHCIANISMITFLSPDKVGEISF